MSQVKHAQVGAPNTRAEKSIKDIKYLGTVQNKTSGLTMAMISINGNSHVVKKGDSVEGMKFQNISKDVIEVKDEGRTIKISKRFIEAKHGLNFKSAFKIVTLNFFENVSAIAVILF